MGIYLFALYLMGCAVNALIAKAGLTLELDQTPYRPMRQVPNDIVTTLARALPIVLANVNTSGKSTRARNAARLTKLALDKLIKINNDEQTKSNNQP